MTITLDVEAEVNLTDIETEYLLEELSERSLTEKQKLNHLKSILNLKEWHNKDDVFREIAAL